jgi:hypothetical protein
VVGRGAWSTWRVVGPGAWLGPWRVVGPDGWLGPGAWLALACGLPWRVSGRGAWLARSVVGGGAGSTLRVVGPGVWSALACERPCRAVIQAMPWRGLSDGLIHDHTACV